MHQGFTSQATPVASGADNREEERELAETGYDPKHGTAVPGGHALNA